MTLKILKAEEIKQANAAQLTRDLIRTKNTQDALNETQRRLDEAEAKFDVALANQRLRWAKEEEEATHRLDAVRKEISQMERLKESLLIPIDEKQKKVDDLRIKSEQTMALIMMKIDDLSEREQDLNLREQKLIVRELANEEERKLYIK